jgi:hypothetical protein
LRSAALALLVAGCQVQAITVPLPLGHSTVLVLDGDACTATHEAVHQRQIAEWGSAAFLARWVWEQTTMAEPRCGSIERPAYAATWACMAKVYEGLTAEEWAAEQPWRCE